MPSSKRLSFLSLVLLLAAACGAPAEEALSLSVGESVSLEDGQKLIRVGEGVPGSQEFVSSPAGVSAQTEMPQNCAGSVNCGSGVCVCRGDWDCCRAVCEQVWALCSQ